jgi:hypothetical protein
MIPDSKDTIPDEIMKMTITLYMVMSDITDSAYGPFTTYNDAAAFAEPADGSVFECTVRPIAIKEV